MVYFTSDLHLGHKAIPKYRKKFDTQEQHDQYMLNKILELGKRDILIVIGDFLFDGEHYDEYLNILKSAKCRIKVLMGNHDSKLLYNEHCNNSNIEIQLPFYSYKNMWLSHCPIHPNEMRNRIGNIHGHMHLETLNNPKYFNVNIDVNNYEFVKLDTIKEYFNGNN